MAIILQREIFSIEAQQLHDLSTGQIDPPFAHINYDLALRRLHHILGVLIPADDLDKRLEIDSNRMERIGNAIVAAEFKLWLRTMTKPASVDNVFSDHRRDDEFNAGGIVCTEEQRHHLLISVRRQGNRWIEDWAIFEHSKDYVPPARTAVEIMNDALTRIEREIVDEYIRDLMISALSEQGDIVQESFLAQKQAEEKR